MTKLIFAGMGLAVALVAAPALANTPVRTIDDSMIQPAAGYAALTSGQTDAAVLELEGQRAAASDPAAMINLGAAYARQGRFSEARSLYRAAMQHPTSFDIVLADGRVIATRKAARMALTNMEARVESSMALAR